jgi:hypothetical protein
VTELAGGILAASDLLFGEAVLGPPQRYANLDLLLGHLADVYNRRESLRKPARVVYANIKQGILPPEKYRRNPLDYLPRDFLEAAGLISCEGSKVDSGDSDPAEEPEDNKMQPNKWDNSHSQSRIDPESLG